MDVQRWVDLGFTVTGTGEETELSADLLSPLLNPLTRHFIDRVVFRPREGRLLPVSPPALAGLPALPIAGVDRLTDFEAQLRAEFDRAVLQLQRRTRELQALGVEPIVDPWALEVRADVQTSSLLVRIAADKQGNFRITEALRAGDRIDLPHHTPFDLAEFREGQALFDYLEALVLEPSGQRPGRAQAPGAPEATPPRPMAVRPLSLGELAERFGARAVVPQKTVVEVVVDLRVGEGRYRFAASRVVGRTFRGLLAGPTGKIWADRFELDAFPGVVELAAKLLDVPADRVTVTHLKIPGAR